MTTPNDIDSALDLEHLDHQAIEAHLLVERYARGSLRAEVEMAFEAHLLDCDRCQEDVEAQASFVRGLRTVAAEEAARTALGSGLLTWFTRHAGRGVALGLLLVATVAIGALLHQNSRLAERVAALDPADLDPADRPSTLAPGTAVPLVLLGALRDGEADGNLVVDTGIPYALAIDIGSDPRPVSYTVTIEDAQGTVRWSGTDLRPNDLEVVQLTFPSGFLPPGPYDVRLEGVLVNGTPLAISDHALRVEATGSP